MSDPSTAQRLPPLESPVIIDVGLHHGDDTDFYLKKGFSVVGIDADPKHVEHCRHRFAPEIAAGRLRVVHAAISDTSGEAAFYVNLDKDDWSSTDPRYGARDGSRHEIITVPAITFEDLLAEHLGSATAHYIKSDIEGGDVHVLRSLVRSERRPRFVSVEAHEVGYFAYLYVLGYRRFKVINQNLNWLVKLPNPAREGPFVEHVFGEHSSGPFGEETPGAWLSFEQAIDLYTSLRRVRAIEPTITNAWHDIHAAADA